MNLLPVRGLANSIHEAQIGQGFLYHGWNAQYEGAILEARGGMRQLWRRTSHNTGDICYGFGYGRFDDVEGYILFIRHNGATKTTVYVVTAAGVSTTHATTPWNDRTSSNWEVTQHGAYLYAMNQTDGLWRWKIGSSSEIDWRPVPLQFKTSSAFSSILSLERPSEPFGSKSYPKRDWINDASLYTYVNDGLGTGGTQSFALSTDDLLLYQNTIPSERTAPRQQEGRVYAVIEMDPVENWVATRYGYLEIKVQADWSTTQVWKNPFINMFEDFRIYATDDPVLTAAEPWTGWKQGRIYPVAIEPAPYNSDKVGKVICSFDLDHTHGNTTATILDTLQRLAIGVPVSSAIDFTLEFHPIHYGGTFLSKPYYEDYMVGDPLKSSYAQKLKDLAYAVTKYNSGSGLETNVEFLRLDRAVSFGNPVVPGGIPLGARVAIDLPAPGTGFTHTRLYRRRHTHGPDPGQWVLLNEVSSATTVTDSLVDAPEDPGLWPTTLVRASTYYFGLPQVTFTGQALTSWKQHLVIGDGEKVFASFAFDPTTFVPSPEDIDATALDYSDPTIGSTEYMSNGLDDKVLALIDVDMLYAVGERGIYVKIGDRARDATPFRKLSGTLGGLGPRAATAFEDGILVATRAGLYKYRATRAQTTGNEGVVQEEEMTRSVRESYNDLIVRGAASPVVVAVHERAIWIIRGSYYLRRTKDGSWEEGQFSPDALTTGEVGGYSETSYGTPQGMIALPGVNGATTTETGSRTQVFTAVPPALPSSLGTSEQTQGFVGLVSTYGGGLVGCSRTGILFRLDTNAVGQKYRTDAGYPIPWLAMFPAIDSHQRAGIERVAVHALDRSGTADGPVRFLAEVLDGSSGVRYFGFDRVEGNQYHQMPFGGQSQGFRFRFTVGAGSAAQAVERVFVELTSAGKSVRN